MVGELIASIGTGSSSIIVPVPSGVVIPALTAFDSLTMTVSFSSSIMSPVTVTAMVCVVVVVPGVKVSVPPVIVS